MKRSATFVSLSGLLVLAISAFAQQLPAKKKSVPARKHYTLPASKENVQWGWFDLNEKPKLTVESGDTVSIETWYHALDQIKPKPADHTLEGPPMDEIARLRKENDGGGPHSVTGPMALSLATRWKSVSSRSFPKNTARTSICPASNFLPDCCRRNSPKASSATTSSIWRR